MEYSLAINGKPYDINRMIYADCLEEGEGTSASESLSSIIAGLKSIFLSMIHPEYFNDEILNYTTGTISIYSDSVEVVKINSRILVSEALEEAFKNHPLLQKLLSVYETEGKIYRFSARSFRERDIRNEFVEKYKKYIFTHNQDALLLKVEKDEDFLMMKMEYGDRISLSGIDKVNNVIVELLKKLDDSGE